MVHNSPKFWTLWLVVVLSMLLGSAGCKTDDGAAECKTNVDCDDGQYCGTSGYCTLDCRKDTDCASGKCTSLGKCFGETKADAGVADKGPQPDVITNEAGVDLAVIPDTAVPDTTTTPDVSVYVDMAHDISLETSPDQAAVGSDADMFFYEGGVLGDQGTTGTYQKLTVATFTMGSPASDKCRGATEDEHGVTLTHNFHISKTEVTQAQFYYVMKYNPSKNTSCSATTSCTLPVEGVSWHEAAAYCNAMTRLQGAGTSCYTCSGTGAATSCAPASAYAGTTAGSTIYDCPGYRLPTEAEWEFAARGLAKTQMPNGDLTVTSSCPTTDTVASAIGWYNSNAASKTHLVGGKISNAYGLFDMCGNVLEWTNDWYVANLGTSSASDPLGGPNTATSKVIKGGSFNYPLAYLRPAYRGQAPPTSQINFIGFRCVRTAP